MTTIQKNMVVLGGGESGVGAAVLAQDRGYIVFLSDAGKLKENYRMVLQKNQIDFEEEGHTVDRILLADEVVKSPGIPNTSPLIQQLQAQNTPIISEVEFAYRFCKGKIIAITGTNGKTTTTLLLYHLLSKAGLDVALAGNVGQSMALAVAQKNWDYYVVELSSFQLDHIVEFRPDIAILLNITPDHLDRYKNDLQAYAAAKMRITCNQTANDALIYCADDALISELLAVKNPRSKLWPFSIKEKFKKGAWLTNETMHIKTQKTPINMSIYDLAMQGKHNVYNSMAAGVASKLLDLRNDVIRESMSDFQSVEHRLEPVVKVHGIEFINDSKATNVNATWFAIESMNQPIVWIVGGVDKGNDYSKLRLMVAEKVKAIVCLGEGIEKIRASFGDAVPQIMDTYSMEEAVKAAYHLGSKDDVVLLSPACASFDLFDNYEDRGRQFKAAVREL